MTMRRASVLAALIACAACAHADEQPPIYVQVWLGALATESDSWKIADAQSGSDFVGDLGTLPFGGGAGQQLWGDGAWQIGYEGGGMVTWKNDQTEFRGVSSGGTNLRISFDNTFWSFGVFMGGVVSVKPASFMRIYAAAGPAVTWAWVENNEDQTTTSNGTVVNLGDSESDVSFSPYARTGFEFVTADAFTFGFSVRWADDEFHFGNDGELKFDQPLWLLTLGARI